MTGTTDFGGAVYIYQTFSTVGTRTYYATFAGDSRYASSAFSKTIVLVQ